MAAMASTTFSTVGFVGGNNGGLLRGKKKSSLFMSAATAEDQQGQLNTIQQALKQKQTEEIQEKGSVKQPQPQSQHEQQFGVKSKNMSKEDGGQWLSCTTRHVRIYAAYIDPVTHVFDQTQTDKLTLILDPTNEFVWNKDTCNMVYTYFQELVDHYEGAPLNEYTLRLIGSDVEHYIRKMLFDGDIKYNMNARTLNFSMGKPRIRFNNPNSEDAQMQDVQK